MVFTTGVTVTTYAVLAGAAVGLVALAVRALPRG